MSTDDLLLSSPMQEFLVTGDLGAGEPTAAQKRAKLLLLDFFTPAQEAAQADVSKRRRYTLDVFGGEPVHGRTATLRVSGSSATRRPKIYTVGVSWTPEVDTTVGRTTTWDDGAVLADKMVKGLVLDVDTRGDARTVVVEADGSDEVRATIQVQAQGRRLLSFSWPQFRARKMRLRATDANHWRLWKVQWIFDEEPLQLTRWETQPLNHGVQEPHSVLYGDVAYASLAPVTLELTSFSRRGAPRMQTLELPATAGGKRTEHILPAANLGLLHKYLFTSSAGFHLYREESSVVVQPWGSPQEVQAKPFGTDDLDKTRDLDRTRDIGGAVTQARGGGGSGI